MVGVDAERLRASDLHVHVTPAGSGKEGTSSGLAMAVAMVSALTGRAVPRDVAMTGEIDLQGNVIAVGGVTAKLAAAAGAGIRTVLVPMENRAAQHRVGSQ